jgi:hypothetical protein
VIFDAYAVVDPGAMVVEALNAAVADGTMPRPGRPDDFALRTQVCRVDLSQQGYEVLIGVWS